MRFLAWFGALGLGAIMVIPLSAQEPTYGIGLGRSLGGNAFFYTNIGDPGVGRDAGESWQMQTFSEWSLVERPITLRAEALYSRLRVNTSLDQWFATVGSILTPQPGVRGFQPYAIGGGGLFVNRGAIGTDAAPGASSVEWAWTPGLNLGAGFAFDFLSLRPSLEIRRHQSVLEDAGSGWIGVSVLVRFP